ncbi:MAG: hypothetical protein R3244_03315 [Thermoanaerobaculia bacterium]|nr:hypothetical protein [Thermoanaerobaculia bacterium]
MAASSSTARLLATIPPHLRRQVLRARELARRRDERSTEGRTLGVAPVDRLLGGELCGGQMVELVGRSSSGRFSVVLGALAAATARGEASALVDLGDALDPQNATALGVDPARLLWARPAHLKPALQAAEALIGAGFPLVVLDLGVPPVPGGRGAEASWRRLARALDERETILLVASPYRVSGTAARTVLHLDEARPSWIGRRSTPVLLRHLAGRLELEKLDAAPQPAETTFAFASPASPLCAPPDIARHPSPPTQPCGSSAC